MTLLNLQHVQRVYNPNSANPVMALKDITFKVEEGGVCCNYGRIWCW